MCRLEISDDLYRLLGDTEECDCKEARLSEFQRVVAWACPVCGYTVSDLQYKVFGTEHGGCRASAADFHPLYGAAKENDLMVVEVL